MNPILRLLINGLLKYLDTHPAEVEALIQEGVTWLMGEIRTALAAPAPPPAPPAP